MNIEDELSRAMHRSAEAVEPRIAELVNGGIARGRRHRRRNRVGAASAVAMVTAAAITAGTATFGGGTAAPRPPAMSLVSATEVLNTAAHTVETRPYSRPDPHRWLYARTLETHPAGEDHAHPVTSETWMRLDRAEYAEFQHGRLVVVHPRRSAALRKKHDVSAALPANARALRTKIYEGVDAEPSRDREYRSRDGQAFDDIAQLLWSNPVTIAPEVQAALYRLMATIPGVSVDRNAEDGAGRPAIAVSWGGFGDQFLLDPATYQMVAQRTVFNGHNLPRTRTGRDPDPAGISVGSVTYSLTRLTTKVVDRPGRR